MIPLLTTLLTLCSPPVLTNRSHLEWNQQDLTIFKRNRESFCVRKFGERLPCMTKFMKLGDRSYYVECGRGGGE